jgi:hypothetical protein
MGQTSGQIRSEIDSQRQQLGANLQQLEEKVKTTVDWRTQFSQHPMPAVGLAFAAGFVLSALMPSRDKDGDEDAQELSNYRVHDETTWSPTQAQVPPPPRSQRVEPRAFQASYQQPQTPKPPKPPRQRSAEMNEITETIDNIRGAVMGLAATRLRSFLAEAIPGFDQEYEQARRNRGGSESSRLTSSGSSEPSPARSADRPADRQRGPGSDFRDQVQTQHAPLHDTAAHAATSPGPTPRGEDTPYRS